MNLEAARCGDCKFWGKPTDIGVFKQCQAIPHDKHGLLPDYEIMWATNDFNEFEFDEPEEIIQKTKFRENTKAAVKDGSGYFAAIKCREDFGCVLFEEKKDEIQSL